MIKYQSVEKTEVLSEKEQRAVRDKLMAMGKTSAHNLTDEERKALEETLKSQTS
jgi:hypothetical protein